MSIDQSQTDVITQTKPKIKEPSLYAILMHNDHYTTMDFVVFVLLEVFDYDMDRAVSTMMQIHETGKAQVAILPKEIAEMKVDRVEQLAEQADFPLLVTLEKI